jgi:hypothetical protein
MRVQIGVDVVLIFVVPIQSLLQLNNIGVTYARTSIFRMEPVRSMPLDFMAMPLSIITIIEVSFVSALVTTTGGIKSKPHTSKGTKFVNLHDDFPKELNRVFASQPSDQRGGG